MARWQGSTTQRGYGSSHRREREARLAVYRPGDYCAHGGEPMTWWPLAYARQFLDLPHNGDRTGYLPGLPCRKHNRGADAQHNKRAKRRVWRPSRRW